MRQVIEEFLDFQIRQRMPDGRPARYVLGRSSVSPRDGSDVRMYLFENGARSNGSWQHYEPPSDPLELLRAKHAFLISIEKVETQNWFAFRNGCLEQSELNQRFSNLPIGLTQRSIELLVAGQQRIAAIRKEIAEIELKIADSPQERAISKEEERRKAFADAERQRQQSLVTTVKSLSV
jgi:hypothetical protein